MGAEIALILASKMPEAGISVDQYLFIWSTNEPAFKSYEKIRKHYPNAKYWSPGDIGHCGYISRKPDEYAVFLRKLAKQEWREETW